jgi:tripartite-type tricarboxylate transporter receptor subunit TctC
MMRILTIAAAGLAAILTGLHPAVPASAESAEEFFKGKTLTYIVATAPGGGYDTYARLIAGHMEKYLPVKNIIVKNVPGAGHIIGANQLYASKPDGLTIGTFNTGLVYAQLVERKGIKFDLGKFTYLGKAASDPRTIMVSTQSGIESFDQLVGSERQVKFAGAGPGSASYNESNMMINALNLNIKFHSGYNGREDEMAMLRGEVDGGLGSRSSYLPFVKNGNGRFLLQIGGTPLEKYPDVPLAKDVVTDDAARSVVALIASQAELARVTAAPPDVPAERAQLLIAAYKSALEDPELLAQAAKLGRPIVPLYGDEVGDRLRAALDQSPEMVAMIRSVVEAKPSGIKVSGPLLSVSPDGKKISFNGEGGKAVKSKVSGSRTKITINGAGANRKSLAMGMDCDITYAPSDKNEPSILDCKGDMATAAAAAAGVMVSGGLLSVRSDGKKISFTGPDGGEVKSRVSGSRTKITIGGADADRKSLTVGMNCDITYKPGDRNEASLLACQ